MNIRSVKIRPLHPHPALLLEDDRRYVAVTDLHIGLEAGFAEKGVMLPSLVPHMTAELLELIQRERADGIVLLGDTKHTVGSISRQEWDEIPAFLKQLASKADVYLVPGNHDSNIRHIVPQNINVASARGIVIGDTLLMHGHTMPSDMRFGVGRIVMGHVHPVFLKKGSVIDGQRVWVYLQGSKSAIFPSERGTVEVVVLPSFNPNLNATGMRYHRSISPIIDKIAKNGVNRCIIVTLDGSIVGDAMALRSIL